MLRRVWLLAWTAGVLVAACGGAAFDASGDESAAGAGAGEGSGATNSGGTTEGGTPSDAGAPTLGGGQGQDGGAASGGAPNGGASDGGAPAALPSIAIVQASRTAIVANVDPSITLPALPAAGNSLIVGISCFSDFDNCVIPEGGVSDNQGNDYALVLEGSSIVSSDTHGTRPYLFVAHSIGSPSGPLTITVNPNGAPPDNYQNFAWGVLEVSGLLPEDSVDQTGILHNTCCSASTTVETDAATQQPNELAVAVHSARSNDNDFNYGYDAAWTQQHLNDDGQSLASQHSLVTRVLSAQGVVSHTWTHDAPSRGVSAIVATFRGAAP